MFRDDMTLLDAMERLRTDGALRDKLGQAGYDAYRSRWTEEAYLERYLGLIEEIRERKRPHLTTAEPAGTSFLAVSCEDFEPEMEDLAVPARPFLPRMAAPLTSRLSSRYSKRRWRRN